MRTLVKYYQTLNDVLSSIVTLVNFNGLDAIVRDGYHGNGIPPYDSLTIKGMLQDADTQKVWNRIVTSYQNEYVMETDDEDLTDEDKTKFVLQIVEWVTSSYGYYKTLIAAHEHYDGNLESDVKITTKHGYADLPQQTYFSLDPETAANKISTLDLDERADQYGTPIQRLKEIEKNYNDALNQWQHNWAREFIISPTEGLEETL